MGHPAESGTHLLYYFRQVNGLSVDLFPHQHELLTGDLLNPETNLVADLTRVVFIDDLCGSGSQSVRYSKSVLRDLRTIAARSQRPIALHYLVLFGTAAGLQYAEDQSEFDEVHAVCKLDSTYVTYGSESRLFRNPPSNITKPASKRLAEGYGTCQRL